MNDERTADHNPQQPLQPPQPQQPQRQGLRTRDVILIGVYTAVYLVLISIPAAPAHLIPVLMPFMGLGCGIFGSTVYLLAITKSRAFGTATIIGILLALLMGVIHGNYFTVATAIVSSIAADLLARSGGYQAKGSLITSSGVFNLWTVGMLLPYMITRQPHLRSLAARYGADYAQRMGNLFPLWMLPVIIVMAFAGGIIGGWLGYRLIDRHFRRAGLA
jgi:energy-coupling factor transport system substrate-specific component